MAGVTCRTWHLGGVPISGGEVEGGHCGGLPGEVWRPPHAHRSGGSPGHGSGDVVPGLEPEERSKGIRAVAL